MSNLVWYLCKNKGCAWASVKIKPLKDGKTCPNCKRKTLKMYE